MRRTLKPLTRQNAEAYLVEYLRISEKRSTLSKQMRDDLIIAVQEGLKKGKIIKQVDNEIGILNFTLGKEVEFLPKIKLGN